MAREIEGSGNPRDSIINAKLSSVQLKACYYYYYNDDYLLFIKAYYRPDRVRTNLALKYKLREIIYSFSSKHMSHKLTNFSSAMKVAAFVDASLVMTLSKPHCSNAFTTRSWTLQTKLKGQKRGWSNQRFVFLHVWF